MNDPLSGDGTCWNINTAGIFKTSYGKNRKEVYNRHTTAKQPAETDEASRNAEPSGKRADPSMISTSTLRFSNIKNTTPEPKNQEVTQKKCCGPRDSYLSPKNLLHWENLSKILWRSLVGFQENSMFFGRRVNFPNLLNINKKYKECQSHSFIFYSF